MEIESYSDFEVVKKRYRELALLYHPDRNPKNRHAEEFFKILTAGYNLLNDPEKKSDYDALLRNYYSQRPVAQEPQKAKDDEVRMKVRRHREKKRLEFIESYLKTENEFPHRYRFVLAILIFVSGILMCYNNWFINLLNFNILYIVAGSFLFGLGSYMIAENIHKRRSFKKAMRIEEYGEEAGPVKIFVLLFFLTPVLFTGLMYVSKQVHLTYFYNTTVLKKVIFIDDEVTFNYEVNGEEISRRTTAEPGADYTNLSGLRVRYSRINPNISELVVLDNQ